MSYRKVKGVAIITVLLILAILFSIASAFFFFAGRGVQFTTMSYESIMAQHCANAGIEYAVFLIRHNIPIPRNQERLELLVSSLSFPAGEKFVEGVGVFRIRITDVSETGGEVDSLTVRSRGQIFRSWEDAQNDYSVIAQRTAYAQISLTGGTFSNKHKRTMITSKWYEAFQ
ncbi:MAG: hypothetical protein J7M18_05745 [Candidatus Eremiobacteraeota bacterium]|nr:hypothetical protein [Candidatus Eremiobacteraeota bacterium]